MSTYPNLEARVSAIERRQINTDTRIEEVAQDMTTSFKELSAYLIKIEENNEQRFHTVETLLNGHEQRLHTIETLLNGHEQRLHTIETTLDDHTKLLNKFGTTLDDHTKLLNKFGTTLDDHTKLLTQILARLPENR